MRSQLAEAFAATGHPARDRRRARCDDRSRSPRSARFLSPALELLADVVVRPRLETPDFARVRELRLNRLRQLSQSAGTMADRTYVSALFGEHSYGHGALGTTASLDAITLDETPGVLGADVRPRAPRRSIVVGDVDARRRHGERPSASFGRWTRPSRVAAARRRALIAQPDARILLVDRPGAPQSELRIGHSDRRGSTPAYHALVTLNAVLGGQFTSRINRRLREEKGVTYGARTAFDFRRVAGTVLVRHERGGRRDGRGGRRYPRGVPRHPRRRACPAANWRAKASLTRGYVRNFETAGQMARAAAQIATHGLPDDTFDRFVPSVEAVTAEHVRCGG